MADIKATSYKSAMHSSVGGGNANVFPAMVTLAAAAVNDVVLLGRMHGKCQITDFRMVNAALGAGTTVELGWRKIDKSATDSTALLAATSTSGAGNTVYAGVPVELSDVDLIATVKGGVATGRLDVIFDYIFDGAD